MSDPHISRSRSMDDVFISPPQPQRRGASTAGWEHGGQRDFVLQQPPLPRNGGNRMSRPQPAQQPQQRQQQMRKEDQQETLHQQHSNHSLCSLYADDEQPRSFQQSSTSPPTSHFTAPRSATATSLSSAPTSLEKMPAMPRGPRQQPFAPQHQRQVSASTSAEGASGYGAGRAGAPEVPSQPHHQQRSEEGQASTPEEERADLAAWAPEGQLPVFGAKPAPQLPDFINALGASTSLPMGPGQVQREMEESINNLLSEKVFEQLMLDPLGRHRFREFLYNTSGDVASLDLWIDLTAFKSLANKVKTTAIALHDVLAMSLTASRGVLSNEMKEDVLGSLRQGMIVGDALDLPQQQLLHSIYVSSFSDFIRHKLTEEANVRLGQVGISGTGLGDAFCLTNPRLRDHPIVLVSPGFEQLTGYSAKYVVGRNCRFLAGHATNPHTSKRIHDALNRGEGIDTLVLNYKRQGEVFWCLLSIRPLRDASGALTYFIGGQTEVTGSLAHGKNLSWLVGSENDPSSALKVEEEFSPSLRAYASAMATGAPPKEMVGTLESESFCAYGTPPEGLAGGQVPVGRQNEYRPPGDKKKQATFKGLFRALTGKKEPEEVGVIKRKVETQQIGGAESLFSKKSKPIELQIAQFASVYSKLIVFRRKTREILFTTAEFLAYCGLPSTPSMAVYRSELIHSDILQLLAAPDRGDWKMTRRHLKEAISGGRTTSLAVGIKSRRRSQYDFDIKYGTLHLSPLMDRDGVVEAFVAVFG